VIKSKNNLEKEKETSPQGFFSVLGPQSKTLLEKGYTHKRSTDPQKKMSPT